MNWTHFVILTSVLGILTFGGYIYYQEYKFIQRTEQFREIWKYKEKK